MGLVGYWVLLIVIAGFCWLLVDLGVIARVKGGKGGG